MATVHTNALFWVNSNDLSGSGLKSVKVNYGSEMLDATTMSMTTKFNKGGVYNWSIEAEFHEVMTSSGPEALLFSLVGTTACVEFRPVNACSSANNPIFSGIGTLQAFPVGGPHGQLLDTQLTWQSAGALTRASSS